MASKKLPIAVATGAIAIIAVATLLSNRQAPVRSDDAQPLAAGPVDPQSPGTDTSAPPRDDARVSRSLTPAAQAAIAGIVSRRQADHQARQRSGAMSWESALRDYRAERRDGAWAAGKENELRAIADSEAMQSAGVAPATALDVSCKRSLCESVAEFPSASAAQDWVMAFMSSAGTASSRSVVRQQPLPGGAMQVRIVSLAR